MLHRLKNEFARERAIIFSLGGEMLWRSAVWAESAPSPSAERALLGMGWLEFIFSADVGRVCAWLINREDAVAEIRFRSMAPSSGLPVWLRWVKERIGEFWVVLGESAPAIHKPHAPSCTSADPFAGGAMIGEG